MTSWANSEVSPDESVAVAEMASPALTAAEKLDLEAGVAARVGGDGGRADQGLALAVAGRVGGRVVEELDRVRRVGGAVERADDDGRAAEGQGVAEHRVVLVIVRSGDGTARVVEASRRRC